MDAEIMEPTTTTTVRTIAVGELSMIDLHSASNSDVGEDSGDDRESFDDAEVFGNDVEMEGAAPSQENDHDHDGAEESDSSDRPAPKKIKKHRPMKASEQITAIAALKEKLATDFPPPPKPTKAVPSPTKVSGKRAKKKSTKRSTLSLLPQTTVETFDAALEPAKKRNCGPEGPRKHRHGRKTEPKPKHPRQQKRTKKEPIDALLVRVTQSVKGLIEQIAKLDPSSTAKDVELVVTAAGDILDKGPNGETYNEEIEALLKQEGSWKEMAGNGDVGLRECVRRFMERFGIIPMGAIEVVGSR